MLIYMRYKLYERLYVWMEVFICLFVCLWGYQGKYVKECHSYGLHGGKYAQISIHLHTFQMLRVYDAKPCKNNLLLGCISSLSALLSESGML